MNKIKKSIAVFAALLLMSSSANAIEAAVDCYDLAVEVHNDLMDLGYSHGHAYAISELVLQNCLNQP